MNLFNCFFKGARKEMPRERPAPGLFSGFGEFLGVFPNPFHGGLLAG